MLNFKKYKAGRVATIRALAMRLLKYNDGLWTTRRMYRDCLCFSKMTCSCLQPSSNFGCTFEILIIGGETFGR